MIRYRVPFPPDPFDAEGLTNEQRMRLTLRLRPCRHAPLMRILSVVGESQAADYILDLAMIGAAQLYGLHGTEPSTEMRPPNSTSLSDLASSAATTNATTPQSTVDVAPNSHVLSTSDQSENIGLTRSKFAGFVNPQPPAREPMRLPIGMEVE